MNVQNLLILLVAGVVVVGGWFFLSNNSNEQSEYATSQNTENTVNEAGALKDTLDDDSLSGIGSFARLMGMGKNLTCEFSADPGKAGAVAGVVYVAGERLRGDFDMEQGGQLNESHMIQDGETIYIWSKTPEGDFAMKFPAGEGAEAQGASMQASAKRSPIGMEDDVEYKCTPWRVDNTKFVPPADIDFMDMETMMQEALGGLQGLELPEGVELPEGFSIPQ